GPDECTALRQQYGTHHDEDDGQLTVNVSRHDRTIDFAIPAADDGIAAENHRSAGEPLLDYTKGNVKARIRMVAQYAIAGERGALVVGTDHAAEAITGFFTKYGDGGADVLPLNGLTKRQGRALLMQLGAPARLYEKPPTADLLDGKPGQTDEAELGLSYEQID